MNKQPQQAPDEHSTVCEFGSESRCFLNHTSVENSLTELHHRSSAISGELKKHWNHLCVNKICITAAFKHQTRLQADMLGGCPWAKCWRPAGLCVCLFVSDTLHELCFIKRSHCLNNQSSVTAADTFLNTESTLGLNIVFVSGSSGAAPV